MSLKFASLFYELPGQHSCWAGGGGGFEKPYEKKKLNGKKKVHCL